VDFLKLRCYDLLDFFDFDDFLPPFREEDFVLFFPRPDPDFLPPPDSLFTVAHARRSASFFDVPRFS
jgi:hypothetical protein